MQWSLCNLALAGLILAGCSSSESNTIENKVDDLVDALNNKDTSAIGKLYSDGMVEPLTLSGDSSVVYRLLTIPGGGKFHADNITSSVIGENAQTTFDLTGDVHRAGSLMGTMTLHLKIELEKTDGVWKFVSGSETQRGSI